MKHLAAALDFATGVAANIAAVMVLGMALLMISEVMLRSFASVTAPFSWEYSSYFMAVVFFLGAGYAMRRGDHVRVGSLLDMLPPVFRRGTSVVSAAVGLAVSLVVSLALTNLAIESGVRGVRSFSPMATPLVVPQAAVAVGAWLLTLQILALIFRLLRGERDFPGSLSET